MLMTRSVKMLKSLILRDSSAQKISGLAQFNQQQGLHSRNKMAMEYIAKGWNVLNGAALLVEATDMGDADAQYELGRNLRIELQPDALYLLGAVYLTGDCVKKDIASALWCFHRASEKV
ncbi:hypothetical protein L1987_34618 [Smallanthus sonchifolius]|uniref:Uncharacterized protein n=1 Tax=Smallanthus sonchifolius TaxID=185202 RepID=A0ACB9HW13_9ASTR|nr:hypothetical protein L1987_34618 [Smallanthus sonchifolius]